MNKQSLNTICIQGGWEPRSGKPRQLPIYQNTIFKYTFSERTGRLFDLKESGYFYTRLMDPTSDAMTSKIYQLGGGVEVMLTSSGQTTTFYATLDIHQAGDHMISFPTVYDGSTNPFIVTFLKMGVEYTPVNLDTNKEELVKAFRLNIKVVFTESIIDPILIVLNFEKFARLAHGHGVPLVMDNTSATPISCRPFEWGASTVTRSTTRYMSGHAAAVGGYIVDSGSFDWEAQYDKSRGLTEPGESYHGIVCTQEFGKLIHIQKATTQLIRGLGSIRSPQNAFLISIGLKTFRSRVPRHRESAFKIASCLQSKEDVAWARYPKLLRDMYYEPAQKHIPEDTCGIISSGLKGGRRVASVFMDKPKLCSIKAHVADSRTAVFHPTSHTHHQLTDEQLMGTGVDPSIIRLSVGSGSTGSITEDICQALRD